MEHGLRQIMKNFYDHEMGLNPCYNGTWSPTTMVKEVIEAKNLRLNPCYNGTWSPT